eukprot:TRINITY_DN16065_c0_g1_i1.p1 TRINITY_DN16065_c0_g1~~TRINITY_DN16065_c0_g1_i1.p1  ORF type:complete len:291 (-),score=-2.18 TRINITY_DN16065_c0_g1_i1:69-860(-)
MATLSSRLSLVNCASSYGVHSSQDALVAQRARVAGSSMSTMFGNSHSIRLPVRQCVRENRRANVWRMEVADPLENFRDSFGNECIVEKRARKELEMSESYLSVTFEVKELQDRMAALVAAEKYEEACLVRDSLAMIEFRKRLLEIQAKPRITYRVGDVVVHRRYGYRGVVYGHDPECSAPTGWQEAMKVDLLSNGRSQPFYHVLVDTRDRPGGVSTYVAQENLVPQTDGSPVIHPWIPKFFVGLQDGTYIPGKKLRQVYPNDW